MRGREAAPQMPAPAAREPSGRAEVLLRGARGELTHLERRRGAERAVVVQLALGNTPRAETFANLEELKALVASAGVQVVASVSGKRDRPDPALFAGSGKVSEIAATCSTKAAELVVFNHELSGIQERNLERALSCRVIDRRSLILDIFAQRARSAEGKLQVELAQLEHLSTRLTRGWSHLERQRGGVGLRGPGEKQLELDRRMIAVRIRALKERLERVAKQRRTQRRRRERSNVVSIGIVGYTNAGKSTLFNRLTAAGTYAADQLFATLDTMVRKLYLPEAQPMVISDTVGFVRHLPHELISAFRATLTEAVESDLLLHVVDGASDEREAQIQAVDQVLDDIGARDIPRLIVINKCDLGGLSDEAGRIDLDEHGQAKRIFVSARTGAGIPVLRAALQARFPRQNFRVSDGAADGSAVQSVSPPLDPHDPFDPFDGPHDGPGLT
ncbi:MAG: GTPase HflX [Casimicrobiaceae bacterium]